MFQNTDFPAFRTEVWSMPPGLERSYSVMDSHSMPSSNYFFLEPLLPFRPLTCDFSEKCFFAFSTFVPTVFSSAFLGLCSFFVFFFFPLWKQRDASPQHFLELPRLFSRAFPFLALWCFSLRPVGSPNDGYKIFFQNFLILHWPTRNFAFPSKTRGGSSQPLHETIPTGTLRPFPTFFFFFSPPPFPHSPFPLLFLKECKRALCVEVINKMPFMAFFGPPSGPVLCLFHCLFLLCPVCNTFQVSSPPPGGADTPYDFFKGGRRPVREVPPDFFLTGIFLERFPPFGSVWGV